MNTPLSGVTRRVLLASTACGLIGACTTAASQGRRPQAGTGSPPLQVLPGPWQYFTPEEGAAVEALADRLIPPDDEFPGGKDAGCAVFIDRQLAGPYGSSQGLYMRPPFMDGTPQQGTQSPLKPAARYRQALAALDRHCKAASGGKVFQQLPAPMQDEILSGLEKSTLTLDGTSGRAFFELLIKDTQDGFFADPIYGGNRDMVAWKMIGFPGARYDYRDWVGRHNENYSLPPVGILGRPAWSE
jgi:gluconate 2-dehydrogenase gamma chain